MILTVLLIFLYGTLARSLSEGEFCKLSNGERGVCAPLNKCDLIYQQLLAGDSSVAICGYSDQHDPIVCCPPRIPARPRSFSKVTRNPKLMRGDGRGAISRQKCAEYSQYVYTVVYSPVGRRKPFKKAQCAVGPQKLIVGGTKAERREFPHMAAIGYNLSDGSVGWRCGGSIISERFILTAAHCVSTDELGDAAWVRVGDLNLVRSDDGANPVDIPVADRITHPEYKWPATYHDIALLRLETPIKFNGWARPACLHTAPTTDTQNAVATGWGGVSFEGETSDDLMKVTLPLVDEETCNAQWAPAKGELVVPDGIIGNWSICAGVDGKDTCQGDSGGPLVIYSKKEYCMYDIVGVTSYGQFCGFNVAGLYTRVYHYIPWIESVVWGRG